jgi:membrane protein
MRGKGETGESHGVGRVPRIKGALLRAYHVTVDIYRNFSRDNGPQAAAAFSFFFLLSLLALAALAGAVLGSVLKGNQALLERVVNYISGFAPGISSTLEEAIDSSIKLRGVLGVGGFLGLVYSGTKVFDSFQVWLSDIAGDEYPRYLRKKLKSLVAMLVLGIITAVGLTVHMFFIASFGSLPVTRTLSPVISFLIVSSVFFAAFCFIYAYLPRAETGWKEVWRGALFTALLVNPVQMALGWYYTRMGNLTVVYGSFAGIILTVIVIYYTGYIIFLGAEINRFFPTRASNPGETHPSDSCRPVDLTPGPRSGSGKRFHW